MTTSKTATSTRARTPALPLRRTVIVALVLNVVAQLVLQVAIVRYLIPPLAVIMVLTLVVAALCATRWRWMPLLAAGWSILSVVPGLEPYTTNLMHPEDTALFVQTLVALALYGIAFVAGIGATVQEWGQRVVTGSPAWLAPFVLGTTTFVVGAGLVAAITQSNATSELDPGMLAQLPAIASPGLRFDQTELRARVGQTVAFRLDNPDTSRHQFDIDEFNVHAPMPPGSAGIAVFTPDAPGTYTFYCGIPGHREAGMVGTLVVELDE